MKFISNQFLVFLVIYILFNTGGLFAQVRIAADNGTVTAGAMLEVTSPAGAASKGLLIPRVALSALNTWGLAGGSPVDGMILYNTNQTVGDGVGFYMWYNLKWNRFTDGDVLSKWPRVSVATGISPSYSPQGPINGVPVLLRHEIIEKQYGAISVSANGTRITVGVTGLYLISANLRLFDVGGGTGDNMGERAVMIFKNPMTVSGTDNLVTDGNYVNSILAQNSQYTKAVASLAVSVVAYLNAGDVVAAAAVNGSGYTNVMVENGTPLNKFSVVYLAPAQP